MLLASEMDPGLRAAGREDRAVGPQRPRAREAQRAIQDHGRVALEGPRQGVSELRICL